MGKIISRLKAGYIQTLAYRSEVFLWLILDTIPVIVTIFVWISIYSNKTDIAGYSLSNIVNYFILVLIINSISASHFEQFRVEQIRMGKIDYFLIRPFSYIQEILLGHVAGKIFYITVSLPFFFLIIATLNHFFSLTFPSFTLLSFLTFALLIFFTSVVEFILGLIIVLLGFWFEGSDGLEHFKWIVVTLLSGWLIPIEMMPQWLKTVTMALPFKYMYAVPIETALYQTSLSLQDLGVMLVSVGILALGAATLWKYAKLQYASAGG